METQIYAYYRLSIGFLIGMIVLLILTGIIGYMLDVWHIIGILSGRSVRKEILQKKKMYDGLTEKEETTLLVDDGRGVGRED